MTKLHRFAPINSKSFPGVTPPDHHNWGGASPLPRPLSARLPSSLWSTLMRVRDGPTTLTDCGLICLVVVRHRSVRGRERRRPGNVMSPADAGTRRERRSTHATCLRDAFGDVLELPRRQRRHALPPRLSTHTHTPAHVLTISSSSIVYFRNKPIYEIEQEKQRQ